MQEVGVECALALRPLEPGDPSIFEAAFAAIGWRKPREQYERYLREQASGARAVIVATVAGAFAGYGNVVWRPSYAPFRDAGIPEVADLNVLPDYRRRGVATAIMDRAEALIAERSPIAGIGVGMDPDYGAAQRMYPRRGYVPDGRGLTSHGHWVKYGELVPVDDDLVLWLTKALR